MALPGEETAPLGTQPLPRVLELAASKAADFASFDHSGAHAGHAWVVLLLDDVPGLDPPERPTGEEEEEEEEEEAPPPTGAPAAGRPEGGGEEDEDAEAPPPAATKAAAATPAAAPVGMPHPIPAGPPAAEAEAVAASAAAAAAAAASSGPVADRVVVDLMHAPGELLREGTDRARHYQRLGPHAYRSLPSTARGWSTRAHDPSGVASRYTPCAR